MSCTVGYGRTGLLSPGVQLGSLLLHLKISLCDGRNFLKFSFRLGFGNSECVLDCSRCTHPAGVLSGVICLHVDDMLGTGHELFESKLKELDNSLDSAR